MRCPGGENNAHCPAYGGSGEIVAVEKDPLRTASIDENVRALGIQSVRLLQADFTEIKDTGTFDRILLDAPALLPV